MPLGRVYVPPPRTIIPTVTNNASQIGFDEDWECVRNNQTVVSNGHPEKDSGYRKMKIKIDTYFRSPQDCLA